MRLFGDDVHYSHENVFFCQEFCKDRVRFLLACGQENDNFEFSLGKSLKKRTFYGQADRKR